MHVARLGDWTETHLVNIARDSRQFHPDSRAQSYASDDSVRHPDVRARSRAMYLVGTGRRLADVMVSGRTRKRDR